MTLHFAHALPFVAQVELRPQAATTRVTVEFSSAASEDFRRAEAHVQVWLVGAALGMGAGRRVAAHWMQGALDVARLISVGDGEPHPSAVSFTAAVSPFELSYINV